MDFKFFKKSIPTLIFLGIFSVIGITLFYQLLTPNKKLKVYSPINFNPKLVDNSLKHVQKRHKIADFKLINQNGDTITNAAYKNKIYVADFFFTRCQTICIVMAYNMAELQNHYKNDADVLFLSHSVTPKMDSVSVLKEYAINKGVIDGKWNVTTGDKKHIYNLARKSYFAALDSGNGDENDFIHTENFVLVDKKGQIRGSYDGTKKGNMQKIIDDITILKEEYSRNN